MVEHVGREAPLLVGICVGWAWLARRADAFEVLPFPTGFDCFDYLQSAWCIVHRSALGYADWRRPLYPAIVGWLGEGMGYIRAGTWVASISICLVVVAAGLGARLLGDAWAGGLAALSVPLVDFAAQASRWINMYPPLAATIGFAFVAAVWSLRSSNPRALLWSGLALALALAVDGRAIVIVPGCIVLGMVGPLGGMWRSRLKWMGGALILFGVIRVATSMLEVVPTLSFWEQLERQRRLMTGPGAVFTLPGACSIEGPGWACSQDMLRFNQARIKLFLPFGIPLTVGAFVASLIPIGGWRSSLASLAVFGTGIAAVIASSALLPLEFRYLLPYVVPLVAVVPVALSRLGRRLHPWASPLLIVGATTWLLLQPREPVRFHQREFVQQGVPEIIGDLGHRLSSGGQFLDCTGLQLETAFLPEVHHPLPVGFDPLRCARWVSKPWAERVWMLYRSDSEAPFVPENAPGWQRVWQQPLFNVYEARLLEYRPEEAEREGELGESSGGDGRGTR